jgi:NYN domain-containing protein
MSQSPEPSTDRDRPLRSALFLDFDNIYLGLRKLDPEAADAFATTPEIWLTWLESGADSALALSRRFLIRNVYLNPASFGTFRGIYTRAGFRTIDCPPLTSAGKNSADIYMVLDIVDALQSTTRYDEFVIASADADFTPVLHRLRAQDRRTTLLTAGISAAAYRAVSDSYISPEVLADAALGNTADADTGEASPSLTIPPSTEARRAATGQQAERTDADIEAVREAVHRALAAADRPIVSAAAAQAALSARPDLKGTDWWGAGSFRAFLALYLPDVRYFGIPSPGYVLDPTRHSTDDIPSADRPQLGPLRQQVASATGAPPLTTEQYAALFDALAAELVRSPFDRSETSKRVRDRTDLAGKSVGRNAINFVLQGLVYSKVNLTAGVEARDLAEGFLANLLVLCANAGMTLPSADKKDLQAWIVGSGHPAPPDGSRLPEPARS